MPRPRRMSSPFLGFAGSAPAPVAPLPESAALVADSVEEVVGEDAPVSRTESPLLTPQPESNRPNAAALALGDATGQTPPTAAAASALLFDAWHASFSDPFSLSLAQKHLGGSSTYMQLFSGDDDRKTPPDVNQSPWHSICSLIITGPGGIRWAGTGWLAGPRTVVTAGHCLCFLGRGGARHWAEQVEVSFPNLSPTAGAIRATDFKSVGGWVDGSNPGADYGAIFLPPAARLPEALVLPYAAIPDADLGREPVIVAGYCTDQQARKLWGFARNIREAQPRQFRLDRSVFGGLSGGPVLMQVGSVWTVVGIQQDGDFVGSVAVRFTPEVCRNIDSWVKQTGS